MTLSVSSDPGRRSVLKRLGAVSLAVGLAGCAGNGDGDGGGDGNGGGDGGGDGNGGGDGGGDGNGGGYDGGDGGGDDDGNGGGDTLPGSDYPAVDDWLTETDVGEADGTYDGEIQDMREQSDVTIAVGSEGNGGSFAYDPSAVAISTGTEVLWDWTGEGGQHNVVAAPEDQIGESDFEFSSGDAVEGDDVDYAFTFDESGIALYHCEPHLSLGMKGAIVVE